ncbi:MAG TPA: hypothetical protein DDW83_07350 [Peptococcaceae bacterium]|nr:hypothetical protein [Peptococcaceae bacterium]
MGSTPSFGTNHFYNTKIELPKKQPRLSNGGAVFLCVYIALFLIFKFFLLFSAFYYCIYTVLLILFVLYTKSL